MRQDALPLPSPASVFVRFPQTQKGKVGGNQDLGLSIPHERASGPIGSHRPRRKRTHTFRRWRRPFKNDKKACSFFPAAWAADTAWHTDTLAANGQSGPRYGRLCAQTRTRHGMGAQAEGIWRQTARACSASSEQPSARNPLRSRRGRLSAGATCAAAEQIASPKTSTMRAIASGHPLPLTLLEASTSTSFPLSLMKERMLLPILMKSWRHLERRGSQRKRKRREENHRNASVRPLPGHGCRRRGL